MAFRITSPVFREGETIPRAYTCQGQDISPPLIWGEPPTGTKAFALIMDDPDAPMGVFNHWMIFNIPAAERGLAEAVPVQGELPNGSLQGRNSFGRLGYGGPCPPPGGPHRYYFAFYALSEPLKLKAGAEKRQMLAAMKGHIIDQAELMGKYRR
ncbi:MAG: YbhB/YbcL family Raf kinase inhibitor-like protein [Syntrophales bacterium LBB04]|nr:YbhB/YbcL family Raf kinase inhibitor-like protein [Syntrophales bacterium LBB04]